MNSFVLLASIVVLSLCTLSSVHSRALSSGHLRALKSIHSRALSTFQQFQRRADGQNPNNPLCDLTIMIMTSVLSDPSLNLTPEQEKLIPNSLSRRAVGDGECDEEFQKWFESLNPFFQSLSPEQIDTLSKLLAELSATANKGDSQKRHMKFQRRLLPPPSMVDEDED
jgi:hypothetical protein